MAKPSSFHAVGDILKKILPRGKGGELKKYELWNEWEEIVGGMIATHASPAGWQGETLVIQVENSAWLQELRMQEESILALIKKHDPALPIRAIRWKIKT